MNFREELPCQGQIVKQLTSKKFKKEFVEVFLEGLAHDMRQFGKPLPKIKLSYDLALTDRIIQHVFDNELAPATWFADKIVIWLIAFTTFVQPFTCVCTFITRHGPRKGFLQVLSATCCTDVFLLDLFAVINRELDAWSSMKIHGRVRDFPRIVRNTNFVDVPGGQFNPCLAISRAGKSQRDELIAWMDSGVIPETPNRGPALVVLETPNLLPSSSESGTLPTSASSDVSSVLPSEDDEIDVPTPDRIIELNTKLRLRSRKEVVKHLQKITSNPGGFHPLHIVQTLHLALALFREHVDESVNLCLIDACVQFLMSHDGMGHLVGIAKLFFPWIEQLIRHSDFFAYPVYVTPRGSRHGLVTLFDFADAVPAKCMQVNLKLAHHEIWALVNHPDTAAAGFSALFSSHRILYSAPFPMYASPRLVPHPCYVNIDEFHPRVFDHSSLMALYTNSICTALLVSPNCIHCKP